VNREQEPQAPQAPEHHDDHEWTPDHYHRKVRHGGDIWWETVWRRPLSQGHIHLTRAIPGYQPGDPLYHGYASDKV